MSPRNRVPSRGLWLITLPLATVSLFSCLVASTFRPRSLSWREALVATVPVRSGTSIGLRPLLTVSATAVLFFRLAPGPGLAETTCPSGIFSSNALLTLPTVRLTASIRAVASASVMPTTGGTAYRSGPFDTTSTTSAPRRRFVPAPGLHGDDDALGDLLVERLGHLGVERRAAHGAHRGGLLTPLHRRHGGRGARAEQEEPRRQRGHQRGCRDGRPPAPPPGCAVATGDDPALERGRRDGDRRGCRRASGWRPRHRRGRRCARAAPDGKCRGRGRQGCRGHRRDAGRPGVEGARGERRPGAAHQVEELPGIRRSLVGVARGGDGDEVVEGRRQARDPARGGGHPAVHVLVGDVDGGLAGEGLGAGEHLEEHQPGGVHVAARVGDAALDLLGREVGHGAQEHALGAGDGLARHGPGQAEVGDLDRAVVVDDDVLGLDVTVDQAVVVRLAEREQHRLEDVEGGPRRERPLGLHDLAQGLARHVLHGQEDVAVVLALVEDGDDVGVRERGGRAGLAAEAGDEALVVHQVLAHDLQGDVAVEPLVDGQVDGRHPAVGDATDHAIASVEGAPDERVAGG